MNKRITLFPLILLLCGILLGNIMASPAYVVIVETNKAKYHRYETVYITVTIIENGKLVKGVTVGIQVNDPDGNPIYVDQGITNEDGKAFFHFTVGDPCCPGEYGEYNVTASSPGGNATTTFEVVPRPPVGGRIEKVSKIELLSILLVNNLRLIILLIIMVVITYIVVRYLDERKNRYI